MKLYIKKVKLLSSLILSFCSILGFCQTILYQAETTSRTVQDPQAIIFTEGFIATSSTSNPFVAKIGPATENPGGGPSDSQAGATNPSGTTAPSGQSFHDTKGNIEVTGGGQLQYTLPITVPPGVKSVAPQINLVYLSGSGNGIAGYGWNLSGITAISRVGRTIEKDGETKGVQLDYSDYYSFNGQKLILKSGEYGKDGAEYVTDKYSNVKIKSVGSSLGISGPNYWEVTFEDGSQAKYEKTFTNYDNGAYIPTLEYNITKWMDSQGNYISYSYEYTMVSGFRGEDGGVSRISSIQWGGNQILNKPHFNTIEFTYVDRDLIEQSYVKGLKYTQNKILSEIKVTTNGTQFKKYVVEYSKNGTSYQFVNKVTEYNSQGEISNPVTFTYPDLVTSEVDYYGVLPYNNDAFEDVKLTGDFNGDSYLDFLMNNGVVKLGAFNDAYQDVTTGKVFNAEARVVSVLLDEEGQVYNGNGIVQFEDEKIVAYIFRNNTFIKVFEKSTPKTCSTCTISQITINEGDIDGDGISDIFLNIANGIFLDKYIIDLKDVSTPLFTYSGRVDFVESDYPNQKYLDVDGDGKVDVIDVSNTSYTVFEFIRTSSTQYQKKIKYSGSLIETKDPDYPILFGDFNGDGNLDFTIPTTSNQDADNWRFYMGKENGFQNVLKQNFLKYRKPSQPANLSLLDHHFYSISDINKDGKSDIVLIYSQNKVGAVSTSGNALWRSLQYEVKTLQANGGTDFVQGLSSVSPTYNVGGAEYGIFQPLTNPIKSNNNYYDIFIFKNTRVHKYKGQTSLAELSRMKSINQGGVITTVDYKELNPDSNPTFYSKTKKEYYPYFSLARADNSYMVSQLQQAGRKQDFRYIGMTGKFQGRGILGYHQIARSSWYADGFENTKIWSGVEMDPLFNGASVKEWSIRTNDESKIFPADISVNNTQLLSFKSTQYQKDQLVNGTVVTTVAEADRPKMVTVIVPKSTVEKNFLTGTVTTGNVIYGDYYLPKQSVTNVNNGFAITTSDFEYIHNLSGVGENYYIGRPKSKTDIAQSYGDTKSAKEEYTYENNLLKTLKTWNRDNTGYVLETYNYDGFGNITQKVVSNSIDSQMHTNTFKYDLKGRFAE
uniref:SpvB/TcaC N-terminal domain-containing protein n=1 Tax=Chryseobacterium sp. TaxID=1871047 RepID=UPI0025BA7051